MAGHAGAVLAGPVLAGAVLAGTGGAGELTEKPALAGHMPRQDEPDEPVPRFIMWVPHMHDRMPGIGDDAPGCPGPRRVGRSSTGQAGRTPARAATQASGAWAGPRPRAREQPGLRPG